MFITEEIESFEKYLTEKSPATAEKYMRDVEAFREWSVESGVWSLTHETVAGYKKHLAEQGYAVRSINSMLCAVNAFLKFIGAEDCRVKTLKIQREVFCPEKKELTRAEYERLCHAAREKNNERLELILQTVCATGIRVSELQFITAESLKTGQVTVSLKGKTRTVFLVKELRKKLISYCSRNGIVSGAVFVTKSGKPVNRTNIWREMKNLCAAARVAPDKVFPHNLRHLFARIFYAIDKDIAKLADILGHSNIETTRIYIISTGNEHRRRMEKMRLVM